MDIKLTPFFIEQLEKCPIAFKESFRKIYQQLRIVDKPLEVKGVKPVNGDKNLYKIEIGKSRIGLVVKGKTIVIRCFLHNQYAS